MAKVSTSHQESLAAWNAHNSVGRTDTESTTHEFLHQAYPEYHITRTAPSKCDLLGYARAGYATLIKAEDGLDATRVYRLPPSRMDQTPGKLEDVVRFACWNYQWQGNDFIVYELTYVNPFHENTHFLFVLASHMPQFVHNGHHEGTDALLLVSGSWTRELHQEIWVYDNSEWIKSKGLWKSVQDSSWDDVVLDPTMKAKLVQDVEGFFDSREMYQKKLKIPWKRGLIFHGVPGNGKTISIKAIINALAKRSHPVQSLYVKSLDACSGPKWSIKQIFRKARRMAPCLLIFEDLDSLVGDNTRNYFLNEVDGLESNDGILMIGSTNHIERLDPAITKRPSRFDRKYQFKLPTEDERIAYCRYWREKFSESDAVEFPDEMCPTIAQLTEEYSFAYMKELFVTSLLLLARGGLKDSDEAKDTPNSRICKDTILQPISLVSKETITVNGDIKEDATEAKSSEEETQPAKRTVPEVNVPASLHDNLLLSIIMLQAKSLLEEMDHASSTATQKVSGASRPPRIQIPWTSLLDEEDED